MAQTFDALVQIGCLDPDTAKALKSALGFRNMAVHQYENLDWGLVHHICRDRVGDFRRFAEQVPAAMDAG